MSKYYKEKVWNNVYKIKKDIILKTAISTFNNDLSFSIDRERNMKLTCEIKNNCSEYKRITKKQYNKLIGKYSITLVQLYQLTS